MNLTGTEIEINKTRYIVEIHETAETARAAGHIATADMLAYQDAEILTVRRPKGSRVYMVKRWFHAALNGWQYSTVSPLI